MYNELNEGLKLWWWEYDDTSAAWLLTNHTYIFIHLYEWEFQKSDISND